MRLRNIVHFSLYAISKRFAGRPLLLFCIHFHHFNLPLISRHGSEEKSLERVDNQLDDGYRKGECSQQRERWAGCI